MGEFRRERMLKFFKKLDGIWVYAPADRSDWSPFYRIYDFCQRNGITCERVRVPPFGNLALNMSDDDMAMLLLHDEVDILR